MIISAMASATATPTNSLGVAANDLTGPQLEIQEETLRKQYESVRDEATALGKIVAQIQYGEAGY